MVMKSARRGAVTTGLLVLCSAALAGRVQAMDSCTGQYSAAALQALPVPNVVALDLRDSSDTNVTLARAFTDGMRAAGQRVDGAATTKLTLVYQILGQDNASAGGSGAPGGAGSGWSDWSGSNAPWLQGGQSAALPDMPRYDMFSPAPAPQPVMLMLRAQLRDAQTNTVDWVATLQCNPQGNDNRQLAYDLGRLIGGALGKRIDRVPL
jgi:hypothetical protein